MCASFWSAAVLCRFRILRHHTLASEERVEHASMTPHILPYPGFNRREFLYRLGYGLGGLAFTAMLAPAGNDNGEQTPGDDKPAANAEKPAARRTMKAEAFAGSEIDMATRFRTKNAGRYKYVATEKQWHRWTGAAWQKDDVGGGYRLDPSSVVEHRLGLAAAGAPIDGANDPQAQLSHVCLLPSRHLPAAPTLQVRASRVKSASSASQVRASRVKSASGCRPACRAGACHCDGG